MSQFFAMSIRDMDVYHFVASFFIYSIMGWIVETIYMSICNKKLTNRGFIKGPICPVYGTGAMCIYILLQPLKGNYVAIYFVGMIVATGIEYLTAQVMLKIFGEVWWDYNDKPFNYKGILCLESSIVWGVYCVCTFGFLQNMIMRFIDGFTSIVGIQVGQLVVSALIIYYMVSFFRAVQRQKIQFEDEEEEINQIRRAWRLLRK